MSKEFEVTGLFYKLGERKLRKHLDIMRAGTDQASPDLMVVMMNPGSSYPLDGIDHNLRPTKAHPDNTQEQIMKVMQNTTLNFARVLNLSDLRTPDSSKLYEFLSSSEAKEIDHSIFSESRNMELQSLFQLGVPTIFGWGVNQALLPLAKTAVDVLSIQNPLGMLKSNTTYCYYHPLQRLYQKQVEWVQHVTNQITRTQQSCAGVRIVSAF